MRNLYIKLLLLVLVSFIFTSGYSKDEGPVKGRKKKKGEAKNGTLKKEFIESFSTTGNLILKKELDYKTYIESYGGDPIYFTLQSAKKTVNIGEEIEIKITAQLIDLHAAGIFENQELRGYSLKVVMPDNFVMTGGDYYDYIKGELSPSQNKAQYSIIGYFEGEAKKNEFKLIRSNFNNHPDNLFVLKGLLSVSSTNKLNLRLVEIEEDFSGERQNLNTNCTGDCPQIYISKSSNSYSNVDLINTQPCNENFYYHIVNCKISNNSVNDLNKTNFRSEMKNKYQTIKANVKLTTTDLLDYNSIGNLFDYASPEAIVSSNTLQSPLNLVMVAKFTNCCYFKSTQKRFAEIQCLNGYAKSNNITFQNLTEYPAAPTITSKRGIIPDTLVATCNSGNSVKWNDGTTVSQKTINVIGVYYAQCINSSCKSDTSFIEIGNCSVKPIVKFSPSIIKKGEGFQVLVEKCFGELKWYRDDVLLSETDVKFNTNVVGVYKASCKSASCPSAILSDPSTPNAVDLWIKHDIENNEIISGQTFKLEAEGCSGGYISWRLPDGSLKPLQNPLNANAPGTYIAYCINSLTQVTVSQATQTFSLKSANKPVLIKSIEGCIFDNEKVTVQAYCSSGMTLKWSDQATATTFPTYKQVGPGSYSAQCCNGGNCSTSESVNICMNIPDDVTVSSNKEDSTHTTYLYPTESAILTAEGCNYGAILWDSKGVQLWGRSITVYGPGVYKARCYVSDRSMSNQTLYEIQAKEPGGVSITSSSQYAYSNQVVTLFGSGCANGVIHWQFPVNGKDSVVKGQSIDVIGPGTYKGWCVSFGKTSTPSTIIILPAGGLPYVKVSKTLVRPNETYTFVVDYSACQNLQWWGGRTLITQNGVTREEWGVFPTSITGPAVIEAQCGDRWWDKQVREVFLAPADNMRLIANKTKAKPSPAESVLLTTYGCDFGYVEWQIGTTKILGTPTDPKRQITQNGPGLYKARCMGDFMVSSDWVSVIVEGDGSMTPTITGPNRICPNTLATITTVGCPYGYYNVWNTVEKGTWSYNGNSVNIFSPQTVRFKCNKNDDSWGSEEKSLLVEPAFPEDVKAKSSGSVVLGSAASFSATEIAGATYLWTVPAGATFTNLTSRVLQVASVTEAYAGEYTCKVTFGSCAIDVKTSLDISACENLYIKAYNPVTNIETNKLTRKPGTKDTYEPLVLEVQTLDGKVIKTMDYTWDPNPNLVEDPDVTKKYRATTEKMGHYQVIASKNAITCPLSIDIFAQPCTVVGDNFDCGTAGGSAIDPGQTDLQNLAIGDEFTTSDYTVVVTDMESGSPAAGWKGKGKLIFNFLKLSNNLAIQIPISVKFEGIKINQCYQLYSGTVITEYDPSWSSVADVSMVLDRLNSLLAEIKDLLANATENAALLRQKVTELRNARADINTGDFTQEYKSEQLAAYDRAITGMVCLVGDPDTTPGNRIAANSTTQSCDAGTVMADLDNLDDKAENSGVNPYFGDVFDENGIFVSRQSSVNHNNNFVIIKTKDNFNFIKFKKIGEYSFIPSKYSLLAKILLYYYQNDLKFDNSKLFNGNFTIQTVNDITGAYNLPSSVSEPLSSTGMLTTAYNLKIIYRTTNPNIGKDLYHPQNIRSLIYHEYQHLTGLTTDEDATIQGIENHLETYLRQFKQEDFIYVTKETKDEILWNVSNLIHRRLINNPNYRQKWINKFKNEGNFDFTKEYEY